MEEGNKIQTFLKSSESAVEKFMIALPSTNKKPSEKLIVSKNPVTLRCTNKMETSDT